MGNRDYLAEILTRKRREVIRRKARSQVLARALDGIDVEPRGGRAVALLRRGEGQRPKIIAEVKFKSPSAGVIRRRAPLEVEAIARAYVNAGAAAVSVLADAPGFGGSPLDVRRVTRAIDAPVLFKEFVIDEVQVRLARIVGASLVLLLVRALSNEALEALVEVVRAEGMEPVVEAANRQELDRALETGARIVGVNARDLSTFRVDPEAAAACLEATPGDRIAVFMSGVRTRADFDALRGTRADVVLVGEGLMRSPEPGARLRELVGDT